MDTYTHTHTPYIHISIDRDAGGQRERARNVMVEGSWGGWRWDGSTWWHHQMETFALLAVCAGNSSVTGEFSSQKPVTRSFDVFCDLCLNKRLSKQSWGWWFETPSRSLLPHCNELWISSIRWWCWFGSETEFSVKNTYQKQTGQTISWILIHVPTG